jgi:large subunit ribosomal protein L21
VIRTGGKQYRVEPEQVIDVDLLTAEVGSTIELSDVLLVAANGDVSIGRPLVEGARVVAEVIEHGREKKILVFKYKAKTRYRRRHGHRQGYTRLAVRQILTAAGALEAEEKPKRRAAKAEGKPARRTRAAKAETEEAATETVEAGAEASVEAPEAKPARRTRAPKAETTTEAPPEVAEASPEAAVKPARRSRAAKAAGEAAASEPEQKPKRASRKKTESE